MGLPVPYPRGADGEVDDERGADTHEVRHQVEQAEPDEHLHHDDIDHQGDEGGPVELEEPRQRRPRAERPDLVDRVVVHDRRFDREPGRRNQPHSADTVQQVEHEVVDTDAE
jgi:hypothetical protein|nr:hypothetical protein [Thermasporomyces composti]